MWFSCGRSCRQGASRWLDKHTTHMSIPWAKNTQYHFEDIRNSPLTSELDCLLVVIGDGTHNSGVLDERVTIVNEALDQEQHFILGRDTRELNGRSSIREQSQKSAQLESGCN